LNKCPVVRSFLQVVAVLTAR